MITLDSFLYTLPDTIASYTSRYLCTNTKNLLIFNDLKVGSRTVEHWFEITAIKVAIETNSFRDFIPKDPSIKNDIEKILKKIPIEKDILFIYRNPFRKTISGLMEDFNQCIRVSRKDDVVMFSKIISNTHNDVLQKILKENEGSVYRLFNWDSVDDFKETLEERRELFSTMFFEFLKIKNNEGRLFEHHSLPMCYSTYQLIKECMESNQNFYLFDLDDKSISLENFLNKYKEKSESYQNTNNSNISHFDNLTDWFKNDSIHEHLARILDIEYNFYFRLKNHEKNIKS